MRSPRALVNRPALILADEPTGNLDSERTDEVLAMLREFNRAHGQTLILVTHDSEVGAACDRIVGMGDGTIREEVIVKRKAGPSPAPDAAQEPVGALV